MSIDGALNLDAIKQSLATTILGRDLIYLPTTKSTNEVATEAARSGAPEGTVVIAEEQTAGRGRLGRTWLAPAGSSLLFSLLLRPPLPPEQLYLLTMIAATSVVAAVERCTGLSCGVKWPNDVLIGGRKVAGILSEMSLAEGRTTFVVVGIGLNVNTDLSLLGEIASTATSLSAELGRPTEREPLLCQMLLEFENRYLPMLKPVSEAVDGKMDVGAGDKPLPYISRNVGQGLVPCPKACSWNQVVFQEWRSRLVVLGQRVIVQGGLGAEEGLAEDVERDGSLLVRRDDGTQFRVSAGDVSLRTVGR